MLRRTSPACAMMSKPATRAAPDEGGKSVVNILIRVLLPAPFEPMRPKISPGKTLSDTLFTATRSPKRRLKAEVLTATSVPEEAVGAAPAAVAPVSASGADGEDGPAVVHADFRIGLWLNPDLAIDFPAPQFFRGRWIIINRLVRGGYDS